jgi:hypothetical protein
MRTISKLTPVAADTACPADGVACGGSGVVLAMSTVNTVKAGLGHLYSRTEGAHATKTCRANARAPVRERHATASSLVQMGKPSGRSTCSDAPAG